MRLYMLISRNGKKRERLWPWFEAPAAGAPMRYVGWVWDPRALEWVKAPLESVTVVPPPVRYPKPTKPPRPYVPNYVPGWMWTGRNGYWKEVPLQKEELELGIGRAPKPEWPPGPARPDTVPGWSWSYETEQWVQIIVMGEPIKLTPARSLSPEISQAILIPQFPLEQQYQMFVEGLIAQGLDPSAARRIANSMGEAVLKTIWAQQKAVSTGNWQGVTEKLVAEEAYLLETIGVAVALGIIAAAVGYLIGTIADGLITPDTESLVLKEPPGTYLMRWELYYYSRMISLSPGGQPYYSVCDDIGTAYVRHMRPRTRAGIDIIDFPGGFREKGHKGAYFVKYTWQYWILSYIGMLTRVGPNFYTLREKEVDPRVAGLSPFSLLATEWCTNFHWYL